MALWGKYLCYALLALSLDLVWGYCGILSLGHGAFFALGGYAMGMYLMRQIGTRGVYAHPVLPDFMVFLNWKELPWFWYGFDWFPYAALMVLLVPGVLAFVFGWFAFRSRVTGVYLSIITQALTFALMLGFFRNNFGFGGNNGLTDFKDILGFNVQAQSTRAALFALSAIALGLGYLIAQAVVRSKAGKVLIAIRDAESRTRFLGYRVENYKTFVFTLSACMAGVAGALYVPQVGIINPERVHARQLHRSRDLGRRRRPRHAGRRGARRRARQLRQDRSSPPACSRPTGCSRSARCSCWSRCSCPRASSVCCRANARRADARRRVGRAAAPPNRRSEAGMDAHVDQSQSRTHHPEPALSRRRQRHASTASARINNLSLELAPGEMRAIIGPNGAGKTTMMDIITGKTRPDVGRCAVRQRQHRPHHQGRGGHRPARHRPQVPEADRVREPHRGGQHPAGAEGRPHRAAQSVLACPTATRSASTRRWTPSA